jgi:hypothetical protein
MPDDALRALLSRLFDHAPTFPPASLPPEEALAEDRRARTSEHAWLLGRLVWPASRLADLPQDENRALAIVDSGPRAAPGRPESSPGAAGSTDGATSMERQDEAVYLEGVTLDEVAARGLRAKIRCGGQRVPSVEDVAGFVRGCRERGLVFKATAGLHHAYRTAEGEHGFLNLLAAAVFGDEEEALRETRGGFALDAESFRWRGREAGAARLADVRASLLHSIGSCSFFEPVEELEQLGILQ